MTSSINSCSEYIQVYLIILNFLVNGVIPLTFLSILNIIVYKQVQYTPSPPLHPQHHCLQAGTVYQLTLLTSSTTSISLCTSRYSTPSSPFSSSSISLCKSRYSTLSTTPSPPLPPQHNCVQAGIVHPLSLLYLLNIIVYKQVQYTTSPSFTSSTSLCTSRYSTPPQPPQYHCVQAGTVPPPPTP